MPAAIWNGTWGAWVKARARITGFATQKELAEAVGVQPKVVSQWMNSDFPPRLRKANIESLANRLDTHPRVLMAHFWKWAPEDAPTAAAYEKEVLLESAKPALIAEAERAGLPELAEHMRGKWLTSEISGFLEVLSTKRLVPLYYLIKQEWEAELAEFEREFMSQPLSVVEHELGEGAEEWSKEIDRQASALLARLEQLRQKLGRIGDGIDKLQDGVESGRQV